MSMDPTSIRMTGNLAGAVPLDPRPPAPAGGGASAGGFVVDVTEETFEAEVIDRSRTVPVVVDFWADWCGPCKQLSPVLEKLAGEGNGAWVLAKIDVDANPRLAQAFGVQGIPAVKAVVGGQLVDLFTGAVPEQQVRQVLDQLRAIAAQMGVVGRAEPTDAAAEDAGEAEPEPVLPPYAVEAQAALDRGDVDAAVVVYEKAVADNPADEEAKAGLAQIRFITRLQEVGDPQRARQDAADRPDDLDAQLRIADVDVYAGHIDDAFQRLVELVRRSDGDDRERVRQRLLDLFEVVGRDDPSVVKARRALTNALF